MSSSGKATTDQIKVKLSCLPHFLKENFNLLGMPEEYYSVLEGREIHTYSLQVCFVFPANPLSHYWRKLRVNFKRPWLEMKKMIKLALYILKAAMNHESQSPFLILIGSYIHLTSVNWLSLMWPGPKCTIQQISRWNRSGSYITRVKRSEAGVWLGWFTAAPPMEACWNISDLLVSLAHLYKSVLRMHPQMILITWKDFCFQLPWS